MASPRPLPKDQVALLRAQLQAHLPWHGARLDFLARCLFALLRAASVNLTKIARAFDGDAQLPSHYKRLQRFIGGFDSLGAGQSALARLLAAFSGVPAPWVLSLDRSDWLPRAPKVRLPWINFLVVGIVHEGVAYPVLWSLRLGPGASAAPERIALLERFLALFGKESVRFVAMD